MAEKRFYWLKLNDTFFNQREIKKLRKLAGGDTLTIIYLKMQLVSLKTNGFIQFEATEDDIIEQLALELDEDIENVRMTVMYLQANTLIEIDKNQDVTLFQTRELIGSETANAERVRKSRKRKNLSKIEGQEVNIHGLIDEKTLHCNTVVTNCNDILDIEKEKEIDIELDIELDKTYAQNQVSSQFDVTKSFEMFWNTYNKKVAKPKALSAFKAKCKDEKTFTEIMQGLNKQTKAYKWNEDNQYQPYASTWLNQERWKDETYGKVDKYAKYLND